MVPIIIVAIETFSKDREKWLAATGVTCRLESLQRTCLLVTPKPITPTPSGWSTWKGVCFRQQGLGGNAAHSPEDLLWKKSSRSPFMESVQTLAHLNLRSGPILQSETRIEPDLRLAHLRVQFIKEYIAGFCCDGHEVSCDR